MDQRTCAHCGTELATAARRDRKYCDKVCAAAAQPPCSEPECPRPRVARGLCSKHWKRKHGDPTRWAHECAACGATVMKSYQALRGGRRPTCSDLCRGWLQHGPMSCVVPASHVSRTQPRAPRALRVVAPPQPLSLIDCAWCGVHLQQNHPAQRYCSRKCKSRGGLARRRGRADDGHVYSWSHVMKVLLLLDGCCAYCDHPIEGPPDPDHVVPLSRDGSNGDSNILPSCRPCNSDKRDLLLHEWATDRARRGKQPVRTSFDRHHPAFRHLLPDVLASSAA